jgi:5'-3' exonuclease
MKKLVLIDGNKFAKRFFFNGKKRGGFTPMTHCFLDLLLSINADYPNSDKVIIWGEQSKRRISESRIAKQRRLIEIGYKEIEQKMPDEDKEDILASLESVKNGLLPNCGVVQVKIDGFEGDDIINSYHSKYPDREKIICSTDVDYYRLLDDKTVVDHRNEKKKYDVKRFVSEYGFTPSLYTDYGAIVGEDGEKIPGVPKCGPTFAKKMVAEYGDLASIRKNLESKTVLTLAERSFLDSQEILDLSFSLKQMDKVEVPDAEVPEKEASGLRMWMIEHGMTDHLKKASLLVS